MLDEKTKTLIPNTISANNILMNQQQKIVAKFEITEDGISFVLPKESNYAERTHPATYEVIGNIYQHPNLINQ